jgi:hypothetical protein
LSETAAADCGVGDRGIVRVEWIKCKGGTWCNLLDVDLDSNHFKGCFGVYIIWQLGGEVVIVGQGEIGERVALHRSDPEVVRYGEDKRLCVTWTRLEPKDADGVEAYVRRAYCPIQRDGPPSAQPVFVNLPW